MSGEFKDKHNDFESLREKRESEFITPIKIKIGDALKQFGKEKGYGLILDSSKNSSMFTKSDIVDVTEEFIKFYNDLSEKDKAR